MHKYSDKGLGGAEGERFTGREGNGGYPSGFPRPIHPLLAVGVKDGGVRKT